MCPQRVRARESGVNYSTQENRGFQWFILASKIYLFLISPLGFRTVVANVRSAVSWQDRRVATLASKEVRFTLNIWSHLSNAQSNISQCYRIWSPLAQMPIYVQSANICYGTALTRWVYFLDRKYRNSTKTIRDSVAKSINRFTADHRQLNLIWMFQSFQFVG